MSRATLALLLACAAACGGDDPEPIKPRPTVFGGNRPVTLQAPSTLEPDKLYPLLVVLHGYGVNGDIQTGYFGVRSLPLEGKALMLSPDGTMDKSGRLFWDADPACCDYNDLNPDDVGYLGTLIEDVMAAWPVDPDAVRLIGHSNGAFMAYRMACARSDLVRAIGGLAGGAASMPADCTPSRPVSVLHVHGTEDQVVPYDGGVGPGAVASVTQWADHDGCGTTRTVGTALDLDTAVSGDETTTETTAGCPAQAAVDLWSMQGSGHIPPSGARIGLGMIQWFDDHRGS